MKTSVQRFVGKVQNGNVGLTQERWLRVGKIVRNLGLASAVCLSVCLFGLDVYYSAYRPSNPQQEHGWTVPLEWTHTSYGTPQENRQLLQLFDWSWWLGIIGFAGEA